MDWIRNVLFLNGYFVGISSISSMNLENEDHDRGTVRLHNHVAEDYTAFGLDGFHKYVCNIACNIYNYR